MSLSFKFHCLDCNRQFKSPHSLHTHCDAKQHSPRLYECCNRRFHSRNSWEQHAINAGSDRVSSFDLDVHGGRYECCGRAFVSSQTWNQHTVSKASHRTSHIKITFGTVEIYKEHWNTERLTKKSTQVLCDLCQKPFKSPSALANHLGSGVHDVRRQGVPQPINTSRAIPQTVLPRKIEFVPATCVEEVKGSGLRPGYAPIPFTAAAPEEPIHGIREFKNFSEDVGYECCGYGFDSWYSWRQHTENCRSAPRIGKTTLNSANIYGKLSSQGPAKKKKKKASNLKGKNLIDCNFCDRCFRSPSAYANHLESGVHGVTRQQVSAAVHTLGVAPPITIAGKLESVQASRIEAAEDEELGHLPTPVALSVPDAPLARSNAPAEPGPPLSASEEEAALAPTIEPSAQEPATVRVLSGRRLGLESPDVSFAATHPMPTTYVPGDFINQGIPYACPICFKTFRTVFALTSHMNSPVHDPDAFLCPKCDKRFTLVSGLIRHLESGCCKLATPTEIYDRFTKLTAQFSRLLTV